jgi:hypothetical protein
MAVAPLRHISAQLRFQPVVIILPNWHCLLKEASLHYRICIAALLVTVSPSSHAADQKAIDPEKFVIEALPEEDARRVQSEREMFRQFGLADRDKTPKGVANSLKIWTVDYPSIKVCFFAGSKSLRAGIVNIAMQWKVAVPGLPLDFGDPVDPRMCKPGEVSHIRIGFDKTGYWSHVGTDSIRKAGQNAESMNFAGFDKGPPDDLEFRATVLHEFGHAIGLEHEHQNPLSQCEKEFDWPKIYKWLGGPPNNWTEEKTRFNMGELHESGLKLTTFDSKSIMLYTFPLSYFKSGMKLTCFSERNTELSEGDKELVRELYPVGETAKIAIAQKIHDHYLALINASGKTEGSKSAVLQVINELSPAR